MFLCKWWARKEISLHRDNEVVLYCIVTPSLQYMHTCYRPESKINATFEILNSLSTPPPPTAPFPPINPKVCGGTDTQMHGTKNRFVRSQEHFQFVGRCVQFWIFLVQKTDGLGQWQVNAEHITNNQIKQQQQKTINNNQYI